MSDYKSRLLLPIEGDERTLYTKDGVPLCNGYSRVVIGGRGPYVEFTKEQIHPAADVYMPQDQMYRLDNPRVYYLEYRTENKTKIYLQKKPVQYADYVVGMLYVSPFDLCYRDGTPLITKLGRKKKACNIE